MTIMKNGNQGLLFWGDFDFMEELLFAIYTFWNICLSGAGSFFRGS